MFKMQNNINTPALRRDYGVSQEHILWFVWDCTQRNVTNWDINSRLFLVLTLGTLPIYTTPVSRTTNFTHLIRANIEKKVAVPRCGTASECDPQMSY